MDGKAAEFGADCDDPTTQGLPRNLGPIHRQPRPSFADLGNQLFQHSHQFDGHLDLFLPHTPLIPRLSMMRTRFSHRKDPHADHDAHAQLPASSPPTHHPLRRPHPHPHPYRLRERENVDVCVARRLQRVRCASRLHLQAGRPRIVCLCRGVPRQASGQRSPGRRASLAVSTRCGWGGRICCLCSWGRRARYRMLRSVEVRLLLLRPHHQHLRLKGSRIDARWRTLGGLVAVLDLDRRTANRLDRPRIRRGQVPRPRSGAPRQRRHRPRHPPCPSR